ncbi:MAG TPA: hypothetical protein PKJ05_05595 [Bacillota bacterium]|nr:hypothetical protein [Bacillota bacterium]
MSVKRLIAALVALVIIASLSGCISKVWVYDFVEEGSITRGDEKWRPRNINYYFSNGLVLDENEISGPHSYSGDFTVSVDFYLVTSASDTSYIEFLLTASEDDVFNGVIGGMFLEGIGSPGSTFNLFYYTPASGAKYPGSVPIASELDEVGSNTMAMKKVGDVLKFYINGTLVPLSLEIAEDDGASLCPMLGCYYTVSDNTVFEKVTIKYKGDQILVD